jgi:hypothetical protein
MKYVFVVLLSTDAELGMQLFNAGTEELVDLDADYTWNPEPKVWATPDRADEWVEYYERHGVRCVVRHPPELPAASFFTPAAPLPVVWN